LEAIRRTKRALNCRGLCLKLESLSSKQVGGLHVNSVVQDTALN